MSVQTSITHKIATVSQIMLLDLMEHANNVKSLTMVLTLHIFAMHPMLILSVVLTPLSLMDVAYAGQILLLQLSHIPLFQLFL